MKQAKPEQYQSFSEYQKEAKRDNKKHKQFRDQRKSKRLASWD